MKTDSSHCAFLQTHCARSIKSASLPLFAIFALEASTSKKSSTDRLLKRFFTSFLISGILVFYAWLIFASAHVPLPTEKNPFLFYSNQTRQDIKRTLCRALSESSESIFLSVYGISDPQIVEILITKAGENIPVSIEYDPSASTNLKKILPKSIQLKGLKRQGLMHKKIAVIDHSQVFLGSANFTTSSLRHHANLLLGLYSPSLATFLEYPTAQSFVFQIQDQKGEIFLLPDPDQLSKTRLLEAINQAKQSIRVAMFTLTHPEVTRGLIEAKKRGVDVAISIDYYTAKGASRKALLSMAKEGVKIYLSQGRELLHHKWAIFDSSILVTGSANWTKAAFSKNHDFLLFLFDLNQKQRDYLKKLWTIIECESVEHNPNAW